MNKKGFTLIELLAVVIILAVIALLAVPAMGGVTNSVKKNMLDKKADMIEEAAILLGQDVKKTVVASNKKYKNNFNCISIIVSDLVPNYLDKDNDNECLSKESSETAGCIVDPSNNDVFLDKKEVIIYYKNKRISAVLDLDDKLTCD